MSRVDDRQEMALRLLTMLQIVRPAERWPGSLVISTCLSPIGAALALAANIAGAVALAIDDRPEACRGALRSGACDFVVTTVDEALRVMKNEIRKRQPLSVALHAIPHEALEELLERGVRPELFADVSDPDTRLRWGFPTEWANPAIPRFHAMGTVVVNVDHSLAAVYHPDVLDGPALLGEYVQARELELASFPFESGTELKHFDERLLALLPEGDPRRRWVAAAPRHFHRERPHRRVVFLTEAERAAVGSI
jgi:urocanate hydratase